MSTDYITPLGPLSVGVSAVPLFSESLAEILLQSIISHLTTVTLIVSFFKTTCSFMFTFNKVIYYMLVFCLPPDYINDLFSFLILWSVPIQ